MAAHTIPFTLSAIDETRVVDYLASRNLTIDPFLLDVVTGKVAELLRVIAQDADGQRVRQFRQLTPAAQQALLQVLPW